VRASGIEASGCRIGSRASIRAASVDWEGIAAGAVA
jgi:hypothetical protein